MPGDLLQQILPVPVFAFMLVFARVGAIMMLLPGVGETFVSPRIRLSIALAVTLLLAPVVLPTLPALPAGPLQTFMLVLGETVVGVAIGGAARITLSGLQVASTVITYQSGLGFAQFFDPTQGSQGALVASFLNLLGLTAIFAANLHLLMLRATADSYVLFPPAALPPFGDFAHMTMDFVAGSFRLGVQISAPFIVYGIVLNVGLGVLNRLMPQIQVSIMLMPLQIGAAFVLLSVSLSAAIMWFLTYYQGALGAFLLH